MKRALLLSTLLLALLLCACGTVAATQPEPGAAPESTQTPAPTPTPFPEPVTQPGGEAYVDGHALADGFCRKDDIAYVRLSQLAEALGSALERDGESFSFAWRKSRVELQADRLSARYLDRDWQMEAVPLLCRGGEDLLVPAKGLCDAAQIGFLADEETNSLYCTPATGDWELPEGYTVPMLMYHMVSDSGSDEANLIVLPSSLEEQFIWLQDHGYTPIWFEDLWHVEDFEKPVILIFDDGYYNMYDYVLPLAETYGVKVEIAIITETAEHGGLHLTEEQILEMAQSPVISFQSHSVTHANLAETWAVPDPEWELRESALWMTRTLKKAPVTFVYPTGGSTPEVQELLPRYYRFGVKMVGKPWVTGEDPTEIYRFFVERLTPADAIGHWLDVAFDDPAVKNYCPRVTP